jgi:hypothetical protein
LFAKVSAELHHEDAFAIGNARSEKFLLRSGRSTRVNQPTGGKQTLDLTCTEEEDSRLVS